MRRLILVVCLLLLATPRAAERWTYGSSDHFEVYATLGEKQARDALTYFERVHAFFADFLKLSSRSTKPTRLIVFSGERQFTPYRPSQGAVAFYLAGPDRDFIVMQELGSGSYTVVVHEYAHLAIRYSNARYPVWLNEGLAEFFSTLQPDGNRMGVGRVPEGRLLYLQQGVRLIPLERLFAVTTNSSEYTTRAHAGVFYSESWALTHMLLRTNMYSSKSDEFLRLMATGTPAADALMTVWGKTPAAVELDLMNYIRQSQFTYVLVDYKGTATNTRWPTRPADLFEGELVTTTLLANLPAREAEARTAFEALAKQKPEDLSLVEARAYFELYRGHRPEAQQYFAKAVELNSTNPAIYRDYARLDSSKLSALLPRAHALAPDDLDVRLAYAAMLLRESKPEETLTLINGAKTVPPEHAFNAFQMLANAYARLNRVAEAQSAAAMAVKYAAPGNEATYAAQLQATITKFAESQRGAAGPGAGTPLQGLPPPPPPSSSAGPAAPELVGRSQIRVTGRLKNMVCGGQPILEVDVDGDTLRLLIDDPGRIEARDARGPVSGLDLQCGAQSVAVRVGFLPVDNADRDTVGLVRMIEFTAAP